jgi:predicted CopG family antitoxin
MTSKNISITRDVYDMLVRFRHGDESFSEVIMRLADDQKRDPLRFFGILRDEATEVVDIVEDSMEAAKKSAISLSSKRIKEMKV